MINFNPEGLLGLHFFTEGVNFPVVIAVYSDWEDGIQKIFVYGAKAIRYSIRLSIQSERDG